MPTLIVTLPAHPSADNAGYDYLLTPDGVTPGDVSRAPLGLLPRPKDAEVVALIAPHHLSWHEVQLPRGTLGKGMFQDKSTPRLRAVLEGLLEDRLLDETSQLHFAIAPDPQPNAPIWVAVCDRSWLRTALQTLEMAGLKVSRVVPEFAPDAPADVLHVVGEPGAAHLVFTGRGGVSNWPLSAESVALLNWPEAHTIVAEPAVAELADQLFKRPVALQQAALRRLQASASPWDLAQFDLVQSGRSRAFKGVFAALANFLRAPRWRAARLALIALVAVNIAGLNTLAWREKAAIQAQRTAVRNTLTSTFPGVQVVVDAPIQMAREVAILQQMSGAPTGRDIETMMALFGASAPPNTVASGIEFAAGELRLRGLTLQPQEVEQIALKMKAQGYLATPDRDSLLIRPGNTP
ncbi:MAG: type II secretion system protein GspL [Rhodoferax sp.]|nr:type II secretion system protein GspL [Rhodoferax sp.]